MDETIVHARGFGSFYTKDDEEFMRFSLSDWDYVEATGLLVVKAEVIIAPVEPDGEEFVTTSSGREMIRETNIGVNNWKVKHDVVFGSYWLACNGYKEMLTKEYYDKWKSNRWLYEIE